MKLFLLILALRCHDPMPMIGVDGNLFSDPNTYQIFTSSEAAAIAVYQKKQHIPSYYYLDATLYEIDLGHATVKHADIPEVQIKPCPKT